MGTNDIVSDNSLSAEAVVNDVDLLTLILLRVPAKSLIRFKCISKHWLSLISDSKFSNNHTRKYLNPLVSGLYSDAFPLINFKTKSPDGRKSLPKLDFLTASLGRKAGILHSCNGLMLCASYGEIFVCNLTTQKFKSISDPSTVLKVYNFVVFYPKRSPHYKVVMIYINRYRNHGSYHTIDFYDVDIYSSDSGVWKNIHFSGPFRCDPFKHYGMVLCDGSIYWISERNNFMRFDVDEENLTTIQTSPEVFDGNNILWCGEYDGRLFLVQTSIPDETQYKIFEMDMHNFKWITMYDVNLKPVIDKIPRPLNYRHNVNVLCFMRGYEEEIPTVIFVIGEKIVSHNVKSNCSEILQDFSVGDHVAVDYLPLCAHKFIESLALI